MLQPTPGNPIVEIEPYTYLILRRCGHIERAATVGATLLRDVAVTLDCDLCTQAKRLNIRAGASRHTVEVRGSRGIARIAFATAHEAQGARDALIAAGIQATLA